MKKQSLFSFTNTTLFESGNSLESSVSMRLGLTLTVEPIFLALLFSATFTTASTDDAIIC